MDVFINTEALQTPYYWDFYEGFIMSAWLIINSIDSPSFFLGGDAESSNLVIMVCSFQCLVLIQEPTQSHLIRTKDTHVTREIRKFQELCTRNQGQRSIYIFSIISHNLKGKLLCRYFNTSCFKMILSYYAWLFLSNKGIKMASWWNRKFWGFGIKYGLESWLSTYWQSNFERFSFLICEVRILTCTVGYVSGVLIRQM